MEVWVVMFWPSVVPTHCLFANSVGTKREHSVQVGHCRAKQMKVWVGTFQPNIMDLSSSNLIVTSWKQSTHVSWHGSAFCEVSDGLEEQQRLLLTGPHLCSTCPWSCSACSHLWVPAIICVCACQPSFWKIIPIKCYMWRLNMCLLAEGTYIISTMAQTGHVFLTWKIFKLFPHHYENGCKTCLYISCKKKSTLRCTT